MNHSIEVQTQLNGTIPSWPWFPLHISQRKALLIGVDLALLNVALLLGLYLNLNMPLSYTTIALHPLWFVSLTLLWLIISSANENYEVKQAAEVSSSIFGVIKTLLITGVIYTLLPLVSPPLPTERSFFLPVETLAAALLALWRTVYATFLVRPNFQRRLLISGNGRAGRIIAQTVKKYDPSYEIIGYVNGDVFGQELDGKGVSVSDNGVDLATFVHDHNVSDIVLTNPHDMQSGQMQELLTCFEQGVRIVPMPELFEEITGRIPVEYIDKEWLISLPIDWDSRRPYLIVKRAMDIVVAAIGLLLLVPFFPLLALAIKLDSSGPIFYRPERLGRGGKPFRLWKFRTMISNADRIGDPIFTTKKDQRITRVGRFLRTAHIDELPQFINVLAGDMSLVGPRPERQVTELEESIPYYRTRYAVKPGATGWALVKQGYAEGLEGTLIKLQYDLYYIKHQSLSFDLLILWKSVIHMLTMRGR